MVTHICPLECGRSFDRKDGLDSHLKQKIPCNSKARKFACPNEGCVHKSTSRQAKAIHLKTCKPKETKESLKKENTVLKKALQCVGQPIQNQTINNNQTNNIDNSLTLNINVNCFGNENKDYIKQMTLDAIKELLSNKEKDQALLDYVKLLRMNPEHPENHNIRIPDSDTNMMLKKTTDGWSNVKASPSGLWDVAIVDFFELKDLANKILKSNEGKTVLEWIEQMEKKIQRSSYKDAGQLIDIIDRLKNDFTDFTKLVYITNEQ